MAGNKRKRNARSPHRNHRLDSPPVELPLHARPLQIQAYEADLIHDRPNLAHQLESRSSDGNRGGLIRWGDQDIWVDRFDVRLLLASAEEISVSNVPAAIHLRASDPLADVGWDDIPSDSEDTFFLSSQEIIEYHHDKRRRTLEKGREDRLRALAAEEEDEAAGQGTHAGEAWGNSDEEPDEAQANLMRRTAGHLRGSPNPVQLEMRILANHGSDPRFAFLRGRWKGAWARMRQEGGSAPQTRAVMGGLSAYASDSDDGEQAGGENRSEAAADEQAHTAPMSPELDDQVKAERRARAKEWMRKRREDAG